MDRPISLDARRIDLTVEPPFQLGAVRVDPRAHEISWDGEVRRLQPQTLKVLVALHDRAGEVVTRGELVERCWDGRFVGEDVINRCILLLRRVATEIGGFEIQTVPRAGYRLGEAKPIPSRDDPGRAAGASSRSPGRNRDWLFAGAAAAVLLVGAAGLFAFEQLGRPSADAVMLEPFDVAGNASLARTFAAGVSADVDSALSAAGVDVVEPDSSGQPGKAQFVLSGRAELPGSDLHLTAELQDPHDRAVLWSTTFTRPASQVQAMQEQVAANLAAVLQCALETSGKPGADLDEDTIKLYLKACALQQAVDPPSDQIQALLQQVTAREPRFAAGWARLAFFAANAAFTASPRDAENMRREARAAVQNALRLDPRSGTAYDAVAEMKLGHAPFAELHRGFQKVLSFDPDDSYTINDECELLLRMGALDKSLRICRRGVELEPLSPGQVSDLIKGLIDDSRDAEAQATLDRALRVWPDDKALKFIHLDYEARVGDPRAALAILDDPEARPQLTDIYLTAYRRLARARELRSPAQARSFIAWMKAEAASREIDPQFSAPMLAGFGDVDDAFRVAFAAPSDVLDNAPDPEFLWEPDSANLRRDPRFIALARKFHLADFWSATGLWPDFCSTPNWPYSCKAEASRPQSKGRA
jgi:DNA-binding winged helix-turn-helix (wHTH) protein/TolB-like protein